MNNSNFYSQYQENQPKPPRTFTAAESVFAWAALAAGYIFCRVYPANRNPFGGFLFTVLLFGITTAVLCLTGKKPRLLPALTAASALIVALTLIVSSNDFIQLMSFLYAGVAYVYYIYSATGNCIADGLSELSFFDFIRAVFILPFLSFVSLFPAAFNRKSKSGRVFLRVLAGIGLAVIPTVIIALLLSFDNGFRELLGKIFFAETLTVISHIISLTLGVPVGMYIFGLFISSTDRKADGILNRESCLNISSKLKIIPRMTAVIAAAPVLILYVIFFIAQWQNYLSAFSGVLPGDKIYSEYARGGFFELLWVSVINLILIIFASLFTKRRENGKTLTVKLLNTVISLFTLALIATAMSKLILYINIYGLTQLRVYAAWFIVLLALVFILVIIRQFVKKLNLAAAVIVTCVLMFSLLGLCGTDTLIARYNIDRCKDGTLTGVDTEAMRRLGDAAIPELVRYRDTLDEGSDEYVKVTAYLVTYKNEMKDEFFGFTVPRLKAEKALASVPNTMPKN